MAWRRPDLEVLRSHLTSVIDALRAEAVSLRLAPQDVDALRSRIADLREGLEPTFAPFDFLRVGIRGLERSRELGLSEDVMAREARAIRARVPSLAGEAWTEEKPLSSLSVGELELRYRSVWDAPSAFPVDPRAPWQIKAPKDADAVVFDFSRRFVDALETPAWSSIARLHEALCESDDSLRTLMLGRVNQDTKYVAWRELSSLTLPDTLRTVFARRGIDVDFVGHAAFLRQFRAALEAEREFRGFDETPVVLGRLTALLGRPPVSQTTGISLRAVWKGQVHWVIGQDMLFGMKELVVVPDVDGTKDDARAVGEAVMALLFRDAHLETCEVFSRCGWEESYDPNSGWGTVGVSSLGRPFRHVGPVRPSVR
jgi:hypothetical protein